MSQEEIATELRKTEEIIYLTTGVHTRLLRPPFGRLHPEVAVVIRSKGYEILKPTLATGDWRQSPGTKTIERDVRAKLRLALAPALEEVHGCNDI